MKLQIQLCAHYTIAELNPVERYFEEIRIVTANRVFTSLDELA